MTAIKMGDAPDSKDTETIEEEEEEAKEAVETEEESTEEKETPSESSPEEKPDAEESSDSDTTETTNVDDSESVTEKELSGLAAQKAELSREIQELRAERRKAREESKELIVDAKVSKDDDLADVAESDLTVMDKWAKARGYVRRDEIQGMTYKEKFDSVKDQWIANHPEYAPTSKENDERWDKLSAEVSAFYKKPANPQDIEKILDRANAAISKGTLPTKSSAQAKSSQEKVRVSSKTSQSGGSAKPQANKRTINRAAFGSGWSEEDLAELET